MIGSDTRADLSWLPITQTRTMLVGLRRLSRSDESGGINGGTSSSSNPQQTGRQRVTDQLQLPPPSPRVCGRASERGVAWPFGRSISHRIHAWPDRHLSVSDRNGPSTWITLSARTVGCRKLKGSTPGSATANRHRGCYPCRAVTLVVVLVDRCKEAHGW